MKGKWILTGIVMLVLLVPILGACAPAAPVEVMPKIKVGVVAPAKFTTGAVMHWGADMAAEEINAAGGVDVGGVMHGIEVIKVDTNEILSVPDSVSAMERVLTVDKVDFVMGNVRTEAGLAMQEVAADHKTIFIGCGAAAPILCERVGEDYDRYKYYFRSGTINTGECATGWFATLKMVADKVREELGVAKPRLALLMEKAAYTEPAVAISGKLAPVLGMEMAGVWRPSPTATDTTAELTAIKAAGAHLIYDVSSGPVGAVYPRQWGELQIPAALVGFDPESQLLGYWETSGGRCNYQVVIGCLGRVEITDKTIPFWEKCIERGEDPHYIAAQTYDAMYELKEAIERAGTFETEAVIVELEKTNRLGVLGRKEFNPRGHERPHDAMFGATHVTTIAFQWRDGEQKVVWPDGKLLPEVIYLHEKYPDWAEWEGLRYKGTVDVELPPWMVEYWKGKS